MPKCLFFAVKSVIATLYVWKDIGLLSKALAWQALCGTLTEAVAII